MNEFLRWQKAIKKLKQDSYRANNAIFEDGVLKAIFISQSTMSTMFYKNDDREHCPYFVYHSFLGNVSTIPSIYMLRGLYFESKLIGNSNPNNDGYELPKKLNGEMTISEKRIRAQINTFDIVCKRYGIIIKPDLSNCQVENVLFFGNVSGVDVYLKGKADIISPVSWKGVTEIAVIDLKLTGSLDNTYWGRPESIDPIQATTYSVLFNLPFYYYVFEYKDTLRHRLFTAITKHTPEYKNEGLVREKELHEKIRATAVKMIDLISDPPQEDDKVPNRNNCTICPFSIENGGTCDKPLNNNVI
jgi:hypothetical protein